MNLVNKIVEVVETIGADIKALYAGKAEKEHTHTATQVTGLGTAATKNVVQATGTSTEDVMSQKAVSEAIAAIPSGSTINVVQEKGNSTTNVMSQKAVTELIGDVESVLITINGEL